MKTYFQNLFDLIQKAIVEEKSVPIEVEDADGPESQLSYYSFSHFIKPDMLSNIDSLVEFWLTKICEHHKHKRKLKLSYKDIKGRNQLNSFHKYLTLYAEINLDEVRESYQQFTILRKVRNIFIHNGGYVPIDLEHKYKSIPKITFSFQLIKVEDEFIWHTLEHARKYLKAAATD